MEVQKIKNKGQARLFENPFLEFLSRTHPLVIWGMYLPVITGMVYYSLISLGFRAGTVCLVFAGGMFFWSFFEYMMHRFLFHSHAHSARSQRIRYIMHGVHHEFPRDRNRLFMPAVPSLLIASTIFLSMYILASLFGAGHYAFVFFPGFMLGYLMYGTMHYAIHAWRPPFTWMKPLWTNHHMHHYKQDHRGYGVSSTLWDHVFGTTFDLKNEKEDAAKVKELMY